MVHYTCDCCKRTIDTEDEIRYVVRMELYAAIDPNEEGLDDDRDHLQEIQDILESIDDSDSELDEHVYRQVRYDLCNECRQRFVSNPFGRSATQKLDFSSN